MQKVDRIVDWIAGWIAGKPAPLSLGYRSVKAERNAAQGSPVHWKHPRKVNSPKIAETAPNRDWTETEPTVLLQE